MESSSKGFWLLVEDDDNDYTLFRLACYRAFGHEPPLWRECDGDAAKEFLATHPEKPELIISDLKMPRMNGLELLSWVRQSGNLSNIRFVMLSNSEVDRDVQRAEKLGADQYRVKPAEFQDFVQLVKELAAD